MENTEFKIMRQKTHWVTIQLRYDPNSEEFKSIESLAKKHNAGMATVVKTMVRQWLKKLGKSSPTK